MTRGSFRGLGFTGPKFISVSCFSNDTIPHIKQRVLSPLTKRFPANYGVANIQLAGQLAVTIAFLSKLMLAVSDYLM